MDAFKVAKPDKYFPGSHYRISKINNFKNHNPSLLCRSQKFYVDAVAELHTYRKEMQENTHNSLLCIPKGKKIAKSATMSNQKMPP